MRDEREFFKPHDETYSEAIGNVCKNYEGESQVHLNDVCEKIRTIQEKYAEKMGSQFHHVLTETALLSFRNQGRGIDYTIPIILSGEEEWEPELQWDPNFVQTKKTQIHITIKSEEEGQKFFKVLLMFESLEKHRQKIEAMAKCFDECVELSKQDLHPVEYRKQMDIRVIGAVESLYDHWPTIERPISLGQIRDRLNVYSKLDVESLQRVNGENLPMYLSDIDLAVAEGQQEEKQIVPLSGLFDEIELCEEIIRPRRIFIQGKPGIGKTTLCRRIMYEYSWSEDLRKMFDLIVRIPLRRLEYSADLNNLFFVEYFQAVSQGRDLSNKLASLVLDHEVSILEDRNTSSGNTLIILDGLDEVGRWSREKRTLLEKLMQRHTVIITSRSYPNKPDMPKVTFDLHLEALGLSTMNVDAYLNNTKIVPSKTATEILQFIARKPFVEDMVRVPIHLDILCLSWDELHMHDITTGSTIDEGGNVSPTITALYQAVVGSLWRKDIPLLGKLDNGEQVTVEVIDAVQNSVRLERLVDTESKFLEQIAYRMMRSDRLEFTDKDIAEDIRRSESHDSQLPLSLERNFQKLSLLRSYPSDRHRKYRFVHSTFQDFFAARYLARLLALDRASFRTAVYVHIGRWRLEIVWRFLTGILSEAEELDFLFDLLDKEAIYFEYNPSIVVIAGCLSECQKGIRPTRWIENQERLADWLMLENRLHTYRSIGSSTALPEVILQQMLQDAGYKSSRWLGFPIRTIFRRAWISENFVELINQQFANSGISKSVRRLPMIRQNLNYLDNMDDSTLEDLDTGLPMDYTFAHLHMQQIQMESELTNRAFRVLRYQRHLDHAVIEELVEWLGDSRLSKYADQILGNQIRLPKETIDQAIEKLTGPLGHWSLEESRFSVCLRQDLHPEAITRVLNSVENAAWENEAVLLRTLLTISRMYLLQPEHMERLVEDLMYLCGRHVRLKNLIVKALERISSLLIDILKISVKLLCGNLGASSPHRGPSHISIDRAAHVESAEGMMAALSEGQREQD